MDLINARAWRGDDRRPKWSARVLRREKASRRAAAAMCCTGVACQRRAHASSSSLCPWQVPPWARPTSRGPEPNTAIGLPRPTFARVRGSGRGRVTAQDRATWRGIGRWLRAPPRSRGWAVQTLICGPAAHCRIAGCCRTARRGSTPAWRHCALARHGAMGLTCSDGSNAPDTALPSSRPERPISNPPPQESHR